MDVVPGVGIQRPNYRTARAPPVRAGGADVRLKLEGLASLTRDRATPAAMAAA